MKKNFVLILIGFILFITACTNREYGKDISASGEEGNLSEAEEQACEEDIGVAAWQRAYLDIQYHLQENLAPQYEPNGTNRRSNDNPLDLTIYLGTYDFDKDGILELIAGDLWGLAVFTYKDGRAEKIADLYYPDIVWCINGVYFKDNSIGLICNGSGGSDFVNFGYFDGEYLLGLYSELNLDSEITLNGALASFEAVDRIYTLDYNKRSKEERRERMRLMREGENWILKEESGETVVLDENFDFTSVLW